MKRLRARIPGAALSLVYFLTNAAFAHVTETNFWAERREQARQHRGDAVVTAGLPSALPGELLRGLPAVGQALSPSLSAPAAEGLPKGFAAQNAEILNALSTSFGTIRKITLPTASAGKNSRIIVHIQDVHQNLEAQKNIGATVAAIVKGSFPSPSMGEGRGEGGKGKGFNLSLVALEGASGPIDLKAFQNFRRPDVVAKVADYLLKTNGISGPVHAAMTTHSPFPLGKGQGEGMSFPPLIGVDDPAHYAANVEAYRRSAPRLKEYKDELAALRADLARQKAAVFNPKLQEFDAKATAYHAGAASLGDYAKALTAAAPSRAAGPALRTFSEALALESSLDFNQVESERTEVVERLVAKLDKEQIANLVQWSAAYRAGQVRYADFYKTLRSLCRENGVDLARFPAMSEYIRYVLLSDRIDAERLFADISSLEKETYARLAKTPEEKSLVAEFARQRLTEKLVDFALTPEEWREYESFVVAPFMGRLSGNRPINRASTIEPDLSSFESFYKEADARDQCMADNLLKGLSSLPPNTADRKPQVAVLVTGGYHSAGMTDRLAKAGFTVISFTPKIEKVDDCASEKCRGGAATAGGSAYLSVFTQEKTPLEKLFQGQKLFLAAPPAHAAETGEAALEVSGLAAWDEKDASRIAEYFKEFAPTVFKGKWKLKAENTAEGITLRLTVPGRDPFEIRITIQDGQIVKFNGQTIESLRSKLAKGKEALVARCRASAASATASLEQISDDELELFKRLSLDNFDAWLAPLALHDNQNAGEVAFRLLGMMGMALAEAEKIACPGMTEATGDALDIANKAAHTRYNQLARIYGWPLLHVSAEPFRVEMGRICGELTPGNKEKFQGARDLMLLSRDELRNCFPTVGSFKKNWPFGVVGVSLDGLTIERETDGDFVWRFSGRRPGKGRVAAVIRKDGGFFTQPLTPIQDRLIQAYRKMKPGDPPLHFPDILELVQQGEGMLRPSFPTPKGFLEKRWSFGVGVDISQMRLTLERESNGEFVWRFSGKNAKGGPAESVVRWDGNAFTEPLTPLQDRLTHAYRTMKPGDKPVSFPDIQELISGDGSKLLRTFPTPDGVLGAQWGFGVGRDISSIILVLERETGGDFVWRFSGTKSDGSPGGSVVRWDKGNKSFYVDSSKRDVIEEINDAYRTLERGQSREFPDISEVVGSGCLLNTFPTPKGPLGRRWSFGIGPGHTSVRLVLEREADGEFVWRFFGSRGDDPPVPSVVRWDGTAFTPPLSPLQDRLTQAYRKMIPGEEREFTGVLELIYEKEGKLRETFPTPKGLLGDTLGIGVGGNIASLNLTLRRESDGGFVWVFSGTKVGGFPVHSVLLWNETDASFHVVSSKSFASSPYFPNLPPGERPPTSGMKERFLWMLAGRIADPASYERFLVNSGLVEMSVDDVMARVGISFHAHERVVDRLVLLINRLGIYIPGRNIRLAALASGPSTLLAAWASRARRDRALTGNVFHSLRVTEVDRSPSMLAAGRAIHDERFGDIPDERLLGNVASLPLRDDSQDVTVAGFVLNQMDSAGHVKAIQEAHRITRPGGLIVFLEPLGTFRLDSIAEGRLGEDVLIRPRGTDPVHLLILRKTKDSLDASAVSSILAGHSPARASSAEAKDRAERIVPLFERDVHVNMPSLGVEVGGPPSTDWESLVREKRAGKYLDDLRGRVLTEALSLLPQGLRERGVTPGKLREYFSSQAVQDEDRRRLRVFRERLLSVLAELQVKTRDIPKGGDRSKAEGLSRYFGKLALAVEDILPGSAPAADATLPAAAGPSPAVGIQEMSPNVPVARAVAREHIQRLVQASKMKDTAAEVLFQEAGLRADFLKTEEKPTLAAYARFLKAFSSQSWTVTAPSDGDEEEASSENEDGTAKGGQERLEFAELNKTVAEAAERGDISAPEARILSAFLSEKTADAAAMKIALPPDAAASMFENLMAKAILTGRKSAEGELKAFLDSIKGKEPLPSKRKLKEPVPPEKWGLTQDEFIVLQGLRNRFLKRGYFNLVAKIHHALLDRYDEYFRNVANIAAQGNMSDLDMLYAEAQFIALRYLGNYDPANGDGASWTTYMDIFILQRLRRAKNIQRNPFLNKAIVAAALCEMNKFKRKKKRLPTPDELLELVPIAHKTIAPQELYDAVIFKVRSLDTPVESDSATRLLDRLTLEKRLLSLPPRAYLILRLMLLPQEASQTWIASLFGVSRERIGQYLDLSLVHLKALDESPDEITTFRLNPETVRLKKQLDDVVRQASDILDSPQSYPSKKRFAVFWKSLRSPFQKVAAKRRLLKSQSFAANLTLPETYDLARWLFRMAPDEYFTGSFKGRIARLTAEFIIAPIYELRYIFQPFTFWAGHNWKSEKGKWNVYALIVRSAGLLTLYAVFFALAPGWLDKLLLLGIAGMEGYKYIFKPTLLRSPSRATVFVLAAAAFIIFSAVMPDPASAASWLFSAAGSASPRAWEAAPVLLAVAKAHGIFNAANAVVRAFTNLNASLTTDGMKNIPAEGTPVLPATIRPAPLRPNATAVLAGEVPSFGIAPGDAQRPGLSANFPWEFVRKEFPKFRALARRVTGNEFDAEDAVVNAVIRAATNFSGFRGDSKISTWFHTVVVNEALMILRKREAQARLAERLQPIEPVLRSPATDPEILAIQRQESARLLRAMKMLRRSLRLTMELFLSGLPIEEIALQFNVSRQAIKTRIHRGKVELQKTLGAYNIEPSSPRAAEKGSKPKAGPVPPIAPAAPEHPRTPSIPEAPPSSAKSELSNPGSIVHAVLTALSAGASRRAVQLSAQSRTVTDQRWSTVARWAEHWKTPLGLFGAVFEAGFLAWTIRSLGEQARTLALSSSASWLLIHVMIVLFLFGLLHAYLHSFAEQSDRGPPLFDRMVSICIPFAVYPLLFLFPSPYLAIVAVIWHLGFDIVRLGLLKRIDKRLIPAPISSFVRTIFINALFHVCVNLILFPFRNMPFPISAPKRSPPLTRIRPVFDEVRFREIESFRSGLLTAIGMIFGVFYWMMMATDGILPAGGPWGMIGLVIAFVLPAIWLPVHWLCLQYARYGVPYSDGNKRWRGIFRAALSASFGRAVLIVIMLAGMALQGPFLIVSLFAAAAIPLPAGWWRETVTGIPFGPSRWFVSRFIPYEFAEKSWVPILLQHLLARFREELTTSGEQAEKESKRIDSLSIRIFKPILESVLFGVAFLFWLQLSLWGIRTMDPSISISARIWAPLIVYGRFTLSFGFSHTSVYRYVDGEYKLFRANVWDRVLLTLRGALFQAPLIIVFLWSNGIPRLTLEEGIPFAIAGHMLHQQLARWFKWNALAIPTDKGEVKTKATPAKTLLLFVTLLPFLGAWHGGSPVVAQVFLGALFALAIFFLFRPLFPGPFSRRLERVPALAATNGWTFGPGSLRFVRSEKGGNILQMSGETMSDGNIGAPSLGSAPVADGAAAHRPDISPVFQAEIIGLMPRLMRLATSWTDGNEAEAEDIVQDTLENFLMGHPVFHNRFLLYRQLHGIMKHVFFKEQRVLRDQTRLARAAQWAQPIADARTNPLNRYGNDPESLLSTLEARARLFDLLPDAKRAILRLRLEGNKKAEIGALLNRNPGTVETNLLRLRDSLRRKAAEATAAELSPAGGSSARAPQETQSKTPARTPETLRRWTGRLGAMWQAAGLSEGPKGQGAFAASYELLRYWGLTIFTGALTIALGGLAAMPTAPWGVALLVALPAFLGAVALPWVRADFLRAHARVDSGVRRMGNLLTGFYGAAAVAGALGAVLGVHFDAGWINVAGALAATALISIGTAFHARYDAKVIAERTKEAHADVALAAEVERAESPAAKLAVLLPHAESLGLGNSPGDVPLEALRGAFMERTAERVRNTSDYAHALAQALKEIPVGIGIVGNILGGAFGPEMVSLINATSGDKTPVLMPVVGPDELRDFDGLVKTVEDFNNRAETPMVLLPVPADMETAETLRRILAGIPRMAVLGSGDLAAPNIQNDFRAKLKSWKIDESRTAVVASVPKNFAGRITGLDLLERDSVLEEALRNALSLLSRLRDALEILAAVARYA